MTTNVLALTRYSGMGASSRVRFLQYIPQLEKIGLHVEVQALFSDDYLQKLYAGQGRSSSEMARAAVMRLKRMMNRSTYDVVWLQREVLPFVPFSMERQLLKAKPLIIDFDDAHHLYYQNLGSKLLTQLFSKKIDHLMQCAHTVVVGNKNLAEYAADVGAENVVVVPSAVQVSKYGPPCPVSDETAPLILGWIGTPITAAESLPLLSGPLRQFLNEAGAKCVLMGADPRTDYGFPAEHMSWRECDEADFMSKIHVGLCPLRDTEWNRGKSGYKIIQYMAAGKPSLVSPVGIAKDIVSHQKAGLHCQTEEDWLDAFRLLSSDPVMRSEMSAAAHIEAQTRYDVEIAAQRLAEIFSFAVSAQNE